MQQRGSKQFDADPPPPPTPRPCRWDQYVKNQFFSVHGHVTYQIKENHKCSNMVANILPADTLDPGDGVNRSKFNFKNMVMLHINLKGITICSSMVANILPADPYPTTPPRPWGLSHLVKVQLFFRTWSCYISN